MYWENRKMHWWYLKRWLELIHCRIKDLKFIQKFLGSTNIDSLGIPMGPLWASDVWSYKNDTRDIRHNLENKTCQSMEAHQGKPKGSDRASQGVRTCCVVYNLQGHRVGEPKIAVAQKQLVQHARRVAKATGVCSSTTGFWKTSLTPPSCEAHSSLDQCIYSVLLRQGHGIFFLVLQGLAPMCSSSRRDIDYNLIHNVAIIKSIKILGYELKVFFIDKYMSHWGIQDKMLWFPEMCFMWN